MIYALLRLVVKIALRVFFRKISVGQAHHLIHKGPLIVVANHPNTFMDPIVVASLLHQQVHFLTNASAFTSPLVANLFKLLHMVPIYRQKDVKSGENTKDANAKAFAKCFEFLKKKGTLIIFPEGTSVHERQLRPIKTGTARIALGAGIEQLHILPIGLNYSDAPRFRSDLLVQVGAPIAVAGYENTDHGIHALTDAIRDGLNSIALTANNRQEKLAKQIEDIYKEELFDRRMSPEQLFSVAKRIEEAIAYFQEKDPLRVEHLSKSIERYQHSLRQLRLRDYLLAKPSKKNTLWSEAMKQVAQLMLGFPLYVFGLIHNYLPYMLPSAIAKALTKEIEYRAPIMMLAGIVTFSIFYAGWIALGSAWIGMNWKLAIYALLLPASGFFAWAYWLQWERVRERLWLFGLFFKRQQLVARLIDERKAIVQTLEELKNEFLAKAK